ncbi:flagellar filament capping protein FliD, partial [Escherichia coli]
SSEDLKVTTEAGAAPGIYTISVTQLAQAQSLRTNSATTIASTKDALGDSTAETRTIKITQEGRKEPLEIKLNKYQTSLDEIRKAIND